MAEGRRTALWSPEALDDREGIWDYYVRVAGKHTAEKVLREIAEVIALIEDHPFADARETRRRVAERVLGLVEAVMREPFSGIGIRP